MALRQVYLEWINECINNTLGGLQGKRMLELGNQHIRGDFIPEKTGKKYYESLGVEHVSVDLNGLDGALKLDLSKPEQFANWHGFFDIITNSGTSEHVEPKSAQYECFEIIHNCLKPGGIAIHLVPDIEELKITGRWKEHAFNYYSRNFFKMLAKNNNYKIFSLRIINGLICSCLQKREDVPFMKDRKQFLEYITRREKGVIYPSIDISGIPSFVIFIRRIIWKLIIYSGPMRHRLGLYRWWKRR